MCVCGISQPSSGEAVEGITVNKYVELSHRVPRIDIIPLLLVIIGDLTNQKLKIAATFCYQTNYNCEKLVEKSNNRKESIKVPSKEY